MAADSYSSWAKAPDYASVSPSRRRFKEASLDEPYPAWAHTLDSVLVQETIWTHVLRPGLRRRIADLVAPDVVGDAREREAGRRVALLTGIHDIGKPNPYFQTFAAVPHLLSSDFREKVAKEIEQAGLEPALPGISSRHAAHRHESVAQFILAERLVSVGEPLARVPLASLPPGAHHGRFRFHSGPSRRSEEAHLARATSGGWGHEQRALIAMAERFAGACVSDIPQTAPREVVGDLVILLTGALMTADRIASSASVVESGAAAIRSGTGPDEWRAARENEVAAATLAALGTVVATPDLHERLLGDHELRPLQQAVSSLGGADGKLVLVEGKTGDGKSEATMLRHHLLPPGERMIFAQPTCATTDAMAERMRGWLCGTGNMVMVSHSKAFGDDPRRAANSHTHEAGDVADCCTLPTYGTEWLADGDTKLLAPFTAATCDQVLNAALRKPHSALRLFALANSHVVLDEIHTYDQHQHRLLQSLLAFLGRWGTNVTALSASTPEWQVASVLDAYRNRDEDAPLKSRAYPSLRVQGLGEDRAEPIEFSASSDHVLRYDPNPVEDLVQANADWLVATNRKWPGARIALRSNLVDDAIAAARVASAVGLTGDLIVAHAAMTMSQRSEKEAEILRRAGTSSSDPRPVIIVGTSAIEAGLDYCVDFFSTDLCPATSLIQAPGRLLRQSNHTLRRARLGLDEDFDIETLRRVRVAFRDANNDGRIGWSAARPYQMAELQRVLSELKSRGGIVAIPQDCAGFVDACSLSVEEYEAILRDGNASKAEAAEARTAHLKLASAEDIAIPGTSPTTTRGLMKFTELDKDDVRMMTRHIDAPSGQYLVLGSDRYLSPKTVQELQALPPGQGIGELGATLTGQYSRKKAYDAAHERTMRASGMSEWKPQAPELRNLLPVRVEDLAREGIYYSPEFGFERVGDGE